MGQLQRVPPSRHRLPCVLLPDSSWSPSTDLQRHCHLACTDHHSPHSSFSPKFWQVRPLQRGREDCWVLGTQLRPKFSSCTKCPASYLRTFPWQRTELQREGSSQTWQRGAPWSVTRRRIAFSPSGYCYIRQKPRTGASFVA